MEWISQRNPAALIAAVPYLTASEAGNADRVVRLARACLPSSAIVPSDAIRRIRDFGPVELRLECLMSQRGNTVEPTDLGGTSPERRCLGRRVGFIRAFFPGSRFPWLESLIEEAWTHHGNRLTEQLRSLLRLTGLDDKKRCGALCLAGYFGDPSLVSDVQFAWENSGNQREVLLAALWAGFRRAGTIRRNLLAP